MNLTNLTLSFLLAHVLCAMACAEISFPYDATVQTDVVDVRSGPGTTFYSTGELKYGDPVTVHRHDRGGWFMIAPPPGSFSYIRVEHVQSQDGKTGTVSLEDYGDGRPALSVVRIGSSISDDAAFSARQLANGDTVRILGRKIVRTDAGDVEMYKITPPDREFRWVKGDFIAKSTGTPASKEAETEVDPFAGALVAEFGTSDSPEIVMSGPDKPPTRSTRRQHNPNPDVLLGQRETLSAIDGQFRDAIAREPGQWKLDELEAMYSQLMDEAATEALVGQIKQRLAAIDRRRDVLEKYRDFLALTTKTSEQEQRLLSMQEEAKRAAEATKSISQSAALGPAADSLESPENSSGSPSSSKSKRAVMPSLDGAGLVQTTAQKVPGGPRHALIATDGRTLAYLTSSAGVDLDSHVGHERGIVGRRVFDDRLKADVIDVRRLVPVRLRR